MAERTPQRQESRAHGILFLLFFIIGIILTLWVVIRNGWWLPEVASEHGKVIDTLFITLLIITSIYFIVSELTFSYFILKFRGEEGKRAFYLPGNRKSDTVISIVAGMTVILLLEGATGFIGTPLWTKLHGAPPEDAFVIEITGEQFAWNLRYPGKDGKFGRTDPKLISKDNPLGIDLDDPAAEDDIIFPAGQGEMHLPLNKPVLLRIRSKDVIHSPYLPNFRVKQDAVPGMTTKFWFVPTKEGEFELACAELCGLGHYRMKLPVIVEPMEKLNEWLDMQIPAIDLYW
jgi:cytochrome c oxidase subunit 2